MESHLWPWLKLPSGSSGTHVMMKRFLHSTLYYTQVDMEENRTKLQLGRLGKNSISIIEQV